MFDPLKIVPDYTGWAAYYDPEGPIGRGKTKEAALTDLFDHIDSEHETALLAGSIVAAISPPARSTT